jgi:uncharacterized protein DUF397
LTRAGAAPGSRPLGMPVVRFEMVCLHSDPPHSDAHPRALPGEHARAVLFVRVQGAPMTDYRDRWIKSSYSGGQDCVEIQFGVGVRVRDSKNPDGRALDFTRAEWDAFMQGVHAGEFEFEAHRTREQQPNPAG